MLPWESSNTGLPLLLPAGKPIAAVWRRALDADDFRAANARKAYKVRSAQVCHWIELTLLLLSHSN